MSEDYDLMLIFPPGRLGDDSRQFLEKYGSNVNQLRRARVGLGYVSGQPILEFAANEDAGTFVDAMDREMKASKSLTVLSSLPSSDLSKINDCTFYVKGRFFRFTWRLCSASDTPYCRRLLDVSEIQAPDIKDQRRDARISASTLSVPALYVDPQFIGISRDTAAAYWRTGSFAKLEFGVLPPHRKRSSAEIEYFSPKLRDTRSAIIDVLKHVVDSSTIPALLRLVALSDDPLYRDVLADGGAFRIRDENRLPTTLELVINSDKEDSVSLWRSQLLTRGCEATGVPWLAEICQAICDDCRNPEAGIAISPVYAREHIEWDLEHPPVYSEQLRETSSFGSLWARLESLAAALPPSKREVFDQLVLLPSTDAYSGPNDAYANELYEYYFWRRPYSCSMTCPEWSEAHLKLLERFVVSRPLTYPDMFSRKTDRGLPRLRDGFPIHLTHGNEEKPWNRVRWRLLLPLGAILERVATNVLDRPDTVLGPDLLLGGTDES